MKEKDNSEVTIGEGNDIIGIEDIEEEEEEGNDRNDSIVFDLYEQQFLILKSLLPRALNALTNTMPLIYSFAE